MPTVPTPRALYALVLALAVVLMAPLWGETMFMDGMIYANVAHNLAEGNGSFWNLHFTPTLYPDFHEHPPLVFFFQSLFFRVLGGSFYVERLYSFVTFLLNVWLFLKIWQRLQPGEEGRQTGWFPLFLWITVYSITWAFMNNMLENTMMLFTSGAVWFILKSRERKRFLYLALAGLALFLSFLCKGFTGLYVWALPALLFWPARSLSFSRALTDSLWLVLWTCLPLLCFYLFWAEAWNSIAEYYRVQVFRSVSSIRTTEYRGYILVRWLLEMLPALIIAAALLLYGFWKKRGIPAERLRWAAALFLFGCCGILPIMISFKQRTFYINTTFMWFCMGLALLLLPTIRAFTGVLYANLSRRRITLALTSLLIILSVGVVVYNFGRPIRDKAMLHDVQQLTTVLLPGETIGLDPACKDDWSLYAECYRKGKIALVVTAPETNTYGYYLSETDSVPGYVNYLPSAQKYRLFKKEKP